MPEHPPGLHPPAWAHPIGEHGSGFRFIITRTAGNFVPNVNPLPANLRVGESISLRLLPHTIVGEAETTERRGREVIERWAALILTDPHYILIRRTHRRMVGGPAGRKFRDAIVCESLDDVRPILTTPEIVALGLTQEMTPDKARGVAYTIVVGALNHAIGEAARPDGPLAAYTGKDKATVLTLLQEARDAFKGHVT